MKHPIDIKNEATAQLATRFFHFQNKSDWLRTILTTTFFLALTVEGFATTNECGPAFKLNITTRADSSTTTVHPNFSFPHFMPVPLPSGGLQLVSTDGKMSETKLKSDAHYFGMTANNAIDGVLAVDIKGTLNIIDAQTLTIRDQLGDKDHPIIQARLNTGGFRLITLEGYTRTHLVSWIKEKSGQYRQTVRSNWPLIQPTALAISPDGYFMAVAHKNGLAVANADSATLIHEIPLATNASFIIFNETGTALFVGLQNGTVMHFSLKQGVLKEIQQAKIHSQTINQLTLSSDGKRLVISSADYSVSVVSTENFSKIMQTDLGSQVQTATMSSDNKILTAITLNGRIHQWDMQKSELINP